MSDHAWAQENIAAYLAGGLTAEEAERLMAHAYGCQACADALASATQLDRGLEALFAPVRPGPDLEDRAVRAFRTGRRQRRLTLAGWPRRLVAAAAVLAVVGTFGGLAGSMVAGGRLPLPGQPRSEETAASVKREPTPADLLAKLDKQAGGLVTQDRQAGGLVTQDPIGIPNTDPNNAAPPGVTLVRPPMRGFTLPGGVMFDPVGRPDPGRITATGGGGIAGIGGIGGIGGGIGGFAGIGGGIGGVPSGSYNGPIPGSGVPPVFGGSGEMFNPFRPVDPNAPPPDPGTPRFSPAELRPTLPADAQPTETKDPRTEPKKAPDEPKKGPDAAPGPNPAPDPGRRVVIRSGDIEFEVESFDAASATVTKLVMSIKGAFVATVNSEKLPNGKVRGSITVRVPPDQLDGLVLDLRRELGKGGELKGVRISSQDITKQYTDLESRLKAARAMEERLLKVIQEAKGEIKDLLAAEKELGNWRTKIEEIEGELRYYANLAALSTLTVTLAEREIRAVAGIGEVERVQAGVEVEDVDKTYQQLLAAVADAKGRVVKSELKQLSAGQFNATLHFEVAPDAGGPLRDRLRQLGRVARLEIDRVQQPEAGPVQKGAPVRRGDTVFLVQLYNLANVAPRETTMLQVAVPDVPAAYQALRDAVGKVTARVGTAQLNEQDRQNVTAQLDFEVRRADEPAVRAALDAAGEVVARQVGRAPEGDDVTDTKVMYQVNLLSAGRLRPREVTTLAVEVADVDQTAAVFSAQVAEVKGRQVDGRFTREQSGRVTAHLVYEVPLSAAGGLVERFKSAGTVRVQQSARDPQAPDGRFATARLDVTVSSGERIVGEDEGLWPRVRRGLAYSVSVLLTSVTWVVFGLCVVLPWALVGYVVYRLVRRTTRPAPPVAPAAPAAPPPAA